MNLDEKYRNEAPPPECADMRETVRYQFDEIMRRAWHGTRGLTAEDLAADPGNGAMTIGALLEHSIFLIRFFTEAVEPGSTEGMKMQLKDGEAWDVSAILETREMFADKFREAWARATPETLMERRPGMPPPAWSDWPALMRLCRPLIDLTTHVGQINYARRQLGKPIGS